MSAAARVAVDAADSHDRAELQQLIDVVGHLHVRATFTSRMEARQGYLERPTRTEALSNGPRPVRSQSCSTSQEWLDTPKNLPGRAAAEARGLVRVRNPDGTVCTWRERAELDALLEDGWLLA
jgi:hypothetical protein